MFFLSFTLHRLLLLIGLAFGAAVLLAACTVGPDYQKPTTDLPAGWVSAAPAADADGVQQLWWQNFHDPVLDQLITQAIADNPDVKIAEARILAARANRASAKAALLPTGDVSASGVREANQFAIPSGSFPGLTDPYNIFQTGFDASWELDLFGGHRRELEATNAELAGAIATRGDTLVSLLAEVARTYIDIRAAQAELKIAADTITSDRNAADIARQRFEAGQTARFDLTQADAQLEQAGSQLPYYRNQLAQAQFSLDVLIGAAPGTTKTLTDTPQPVPVAAQAVVLAAPAKVIANRPDILVAERQLAAATARQGEAVAQFFPDISLTGFLGLLNTDAGSLLRTASRSYLLSGKLVWPILSYGSLEANLDAANAQQQAALAQYQKTVLSALSDVERSVTSYTERERYRQALDRTVAADQHADAIARERYKEGLTSFLEVLDAERTLYAAQTQAALASAETSQDLVAVYKSLGGGWQSAPGDNKAP